VYSEDVYSGDNLEVHVEGTLVARPVDLMEAFKVLVAAHYVFDIPYNKKAHDTLTFLQKGILGIRDKTRISSSIRNLLNVIA